MAERACERLAKGFIENESAESRHCGYNIPLEVTSCQK